VDATSFQTQNIAAYATQLAFSQRPQERESTERPGEATSESSAARQGERVTLSQEAQQLAQQERANSTSQAPATQPVSGPEAVLRKGLEQPEEARAAVAKSVTQAISAYRDNAVTASIS